MFFRALHCKKEEAVGDDRVFGAVDAILTFEELGGWLKAEGITISECEEKPFGNPDPRINRIYPVGGGIVKSVMEQKEMKDTYHKLYVDGLDACMELFKAWRRRNSATALSRQMYVTEAVLKDLHRTSGRILL